MIIGIDMGHTLSGNDYGASGIKEESLLTREVGNKVIQMLQTLGHTVVNCTTDAAFNLNASLAYRVDKANKYNLDLFVSIHFNCYNSQAHGSEVWTYGGKEFVEATRVLKNLADLGYTNRGIKDGSNLYVLRNTKAKSMLIECCFIDNKEDVNRYNAEHMARAIVEGIAGQSIVVKPVQKEEKKVDLIVYGEGADKRAAEYLSDYLKTPIIEKNNLNKDIIDASRNIYMVGGKDKPTPNTTLISGTNRFDTMQAVLNYIKK